MSIESWEDAIFLTPSEQKRHVAFRYVAGERGPELKLYTQRTDATVPIGYYHTHLPTDKTELLNLALSIKQFAEEMV